MGWSTVENGALKRIKRLVYIASSLCLVVSTLYLLAVFIPVYYFHGYVHGYYSLMEYRLYYAHTHQPVPMPVTDYVKHVVIVFTVLSAVMLTLSALSLVIASRKPLSSAGLVYGVATGLVVLYGLLNGYIFRATGHDLARFNSLVRDVVVYRTLAGTVTYEGVRLEKLYLHELISTLILYILVAGVATSTLASGLAVLWFYRGRPIKPPERIGGLKPIVAIATSSMALLASVFTYYPSSLSITPQPPPVTLEPPSYTYTCTALTRTARGALAYTDFETLPTGWTNYGGSWSSVGGVAGAKGNVLQGSDNNRGVGDASHYYYNTDLSTHASLWVVSKTRWVSGTGWYGISMMNTGRNRVYEISITTGGYLEIWSYNVEVLTWRRHAQVSIPGYNSTAWYTIVVHYSVVGTTITISAHLYDASGRYVTGTSATISHANVFRPAYIGVTVDGPTAYFDDFAISTVDPRSILFTGFYTGMRVEIWDNLGLLVNSTVAPASSFHLNVTADVVVGTGVDGRIVVRYPDGYLCGNLTVPATDAVIGGDVYILTTRGLNYTLGANKTSGVVWVNISYSAAFTTISRVLGVNSTRTLYARLVLEYYETGEYIYVNVTLVGRAESTPIVIRGGAPITTATSFVELNTGLANHVFIYGYYTQPVAQVSRLDLRLELCTLPDGRGTCVSYPLRLMLVGYVA